MLSPFPIPPSRVLPRFPHQQAHKVVGRVGDVRGSPLPACPSTAQEARSNRQSRSERIVYRGRQRDSCRSRLWWFTQGSLYASFHSSLSIPFRLNLLVIPPLQGTTRVRTSVHQKISRSSTAMPMRIGGGYGIVVSAPIPSSPTRTSSKHGLPNLSTVSSANPERSAFPLTSVLSRSCVIPIYALPYAHHRLSTQVRFPR